MTPTGMTTPTATASVWFRVEEGVEKEDDDCRDDIASEQDAVFRRDQLPCATRVL